MTKHDHTPDNIPSGTGGITFSDYKRSEEELQQSLALLETILESTDNGILVIGDDGKVLKLNRKFVTMWRIPEEIIATGEDEKMLDNILTQLSDPEHFLAKVRALYDHPEEKSNDQITFKDGRIFERTSHPMLVAGKPKGRVWSFRDITESKRADDALRTSQFFLDSVIEHSPNATWISDEAGTLLRLNQACRDILHLRDEDVVGKYNLLRDNIVASQGFLPQVKDVFDKGVSTHFIISYDTGNVEGIFIAEPTSVVLDVHISPIIDRSGKVTNAVIQHVDITERIQAEEHIRQLANEMRVTLATISSGLSRIRDRRVEWANEAHDDMFGYARGETKGMATSVFYPDDESYARMDEIAYPLLAKGQSYSAEMEMKKKDGTRFWCSLNGCSVNPDDPAEGSIWMIENISERKRVEEEMRRTKLLLEQTFEQSPIAQVLVSMPDGVIRMVNPACLHFLGIDDQPSPLNVPLMDLLIPWKDYNLHGVEGTPMDLPLPRSLRGITTNGEERYIVRKDGSVRFELVYASPIFDAAGSLIAGYAIMMDITGRKQAEEKLHQLSQAIEQSPVSIVITDTKGQIEYVNTRFVEVTGYQYDEVIGQNPRILKSGYTSPDEYSQLWMALRTKGEWQGEFHNKRKDGSLYWETAKISGIVNAQGETTHYLAIKEDITERKHTEDHLQRIEERLRQSQKMDAIGQLAGGIAHDFNNVLGGIIGYTDLSLGLAKKGSILESNLLKVMKASERAKQLVKQILTFSRQSNSPKSVVSIRVIIQEVLELLRASIPSTVIIESFLAADTEPVLADATKLHEALLNLATNAVHAMNRKGTLTVRLFQTDLERIEYGRTGEILPGRYSVIEMSDTGCGMDDVTLSKAFEPFFTTKAVGEGTGMGLSVVLGVVQSHGGDLQVESVINTGTTVRIFLPTTDIPAAGAAEDEPAYVDAGSERVLFVDDEQILVDMAKDLLTSRGYTVIGMTDSVQAFKFIQQGADRIDILITDQTMPRMSGLELAVAALQIRKDLPIILCTGYSRDISPEQAAEIGIKLFLMKPYGAREISNAIQEVLNEAKKGGS